MPESIPIHLIRQWCYCPRVVYYLELTTFKIEMPRWVQQGEEFHIAEEKFWQRRNLSRFGLKDGNKHYNLSLKSSSLHMHGLADLVIETADAVYPLEFKLSATNKKQGDILQLIAYSMLAEEHFSKQCKVAFLVGKGTILHQITVDAKKKKQVLDTLNNIRIMLRKGRKPDTSASIFQCNNCEYLNFCNDRL